MMTLVPAIDVVKFLIDLKQCSRSISTNVQLAFVRPAHLSDHQSLVFAANADDLKFAIGKKAGLILASEGDATQFPNEQNLIAVQDLNLCRAEVITQFFYLTPRDRYLQSKNQTEPQIDTSTVVADTAFVGKNVRIGANGFIGPGCVIENDVVLGDNVTLHAGVFIGHRCRIGNRVEIHPNTVIGADGFSYAQDGNGKHHKIPQLGNVIIKDDVEIGANTCIDRATLETTLVSAGTKIDNLVHIAHNCQVGEDVILTAGFMTGGSSHFGQGFMAGGHATVRDHVKIAPRVMLGGYSCVLSDITEPGIYSGYPARPATLTNRILAAQAHLPEMLKKLRKLAPLLKQDE